MTEPLIIFPSSDQLTQRLEELESTVSQSRLVLDMINQDLMAVRETHRYALTQPDSDMDTKEERDEARKELANLKAKKSVASSKSVKMRKAKMQTERELNAAEEWFEAVKENLHLDPKLDLSGLCLRGLPAALLASPGLLRLDLSGNKLREIPKEISSLRGLEDLNLSNNRLAEIDPHFWSLTGLKRLDLSGNSLSDLPEMEGEVTTLQQLGLENLNVGNLVGLSFCDLSSNSLKDLPESIAEMTNLSVLRLRQNNLSRMPDGLVDVTSLLELDVGRNKVKKLSKGEREEKERSIFIVSD